MYGIARLLTAATLLLALTSLASAAQPAANDGSSDDATKAKTHFDRGMVHYASKDYLAAIAEFQRAYALEARREYLFAWAQSARLSGDCESAAPLYRRYLGTSRNE
jgi:hypothetical protein